MIHTSLPHGREVFHWKNSVIYARKDRAFRDVAKAG